MAAIISPGRITGTITAPASKSMMQRACAAALLHGGTTTIINPGISDDDNAALHIIETLGAKVTRDADRIVVKGADISSAKGNVHCGESGLSARLFIPIAALSQNEITITGSGTLSGRAMNTIGELLPELGVTVSYTHGKLPLTLQGPLQPKDIFIDGSESSQFLTGLLYAYAFTAKQKLTITASNLKSKPYIDLTLDVLARFGKIIHHEAYERFIIDPELFEHKDEVTITIEGDWSAAANWLVGGAIAGAVTIDGLNMASTQADRAILTVLESAGVDFTVSSHAVSVKPAHKILPFGFDATDCPDLFPPLAILAACCRGECSITGVHRLFGKESNRLVSIGDMLYGFGVFFSIEDDTLVIESSGVPDFATIESYNDHRIVMASAIGALRAKKPVVILDEYVVSKSYPQFFADFVSLGGNCTLQQD